ncbi:LCP family protein [Paucisalibacillus sp. EB02]|uniref:LCP family protein n=1 Tax=Paucisalibacillus sp. EB02 TaxID=1347087 RepID=UPI0004B297EC|nr:LCP family protein [Paucisalibacillus sp. EB02]
MAKAKRSKKWVIYSIISIILLLLIIVGYGIYLYQKTHNIVEGSYEGINRKQSNLRDEKVDPDIHNVSVLFLGVDTSEFRGYGEKSRTDAILLATFNKKDDSIKLLTIPRDTYVYVPVMNTYTKINHAHFYGGPEATMETVEQFLHIPVDYYVRMNFNGFIEVVDALGGIEYEVPYEIVESNSMDKKNSIHLYPGNQQLNGEEALALARTRKYDTDVARGKRQQEIVKTIANKALSLSSIPKLDKVIEAIGNNMSTNLTFDELTKFQSYGLSHDLTIETVNFDGVGDYDDGAWYYQVEEDSRIQIQEELQNHLELNHLSNGPTKNKISIIE